MEFGTLHTELYRQALEHGRLPSGHRTPAEQAAVDELVTARLLRIEPLTGATVPCTPETAAAHLLGPIDAVIRRHQREAREAEEQLAVFRAAYQEQRRRGGHGRHEQLEQLRSLDVIRATLGDLTDGAEREIRTAHPVLPPPEALDEGLERTTASLARGLRLRTVYPHSVLTRPYMRRHLEKLVQAGAEFRTVSRVASRLILFDRSVAVLPTTGDEPSALVVREESLLGYLHAGWETVWEGALPFELTPDRSSYEEADQEVKRAIVRLLDQGLKDDVVARKLGISVRVCRRHIAEILQEFGAASRFQAGSRAHLYGWLDG
ncbi:hypothetical protein ACIA8O_09470 [Kitasatospora sp. NPDC051853]|uniref:hypothetical protein n=1 Tax=Kitasatospora sp. NPDC051853 TaxID=3364058 RepID=UPI0037A5657B